MEGMQEEKNIIIAGRRESGRQFLQECFINALDKIACEKYPDAKPEEVEWFCGDQYFPAKVLLKYRGELVGYASIAMRGCETLVEYREFVYYKNQLIGYLDKSKKDEF